MLLFLPIDRVNTDDCSECACSTTGMITSPIFLGDNAMYLDKSWLIHVPSGQEIKINFISIDIFYDPECP